ncbi:hypothetical protein U9M48_000955, partial [Paspalum notatum var. saurae]
TIHTHNSSYITFTPPYEYPEYVDDGGAVNCSVPINERIRMRKQIKRIQDILTDSNKSNLLNQNSSSSTAKDTDKESRSSKQKEIDELYRSIEHKVYGRDNDRDHICKMLREGRADANAASSNNSKRPYSVVGIYGLTGSGKSTLAKYVCDYEKEKVGKSKHFNPIVFIYVNKVFNVKDIFHDMLKQIRGKKWSSDGKSTETLKKHLEEGLKNKRFLLVENDEAGDKILLKTDNRKKERDILLDALRVGRRGSRILVTSQTENAAAALGAHKKQNIQIRELKETEYLSLFIHNALEGAVYDDAAEEEEYKRVGRRIANKLHRSPIAAVTVARRLQRNRSIGFWKTTANHDLLSSTMGALWWSYQKLGADTRRCFAYCSTFPSGYELNRDELVRIWIAQGFVSTSSNAAEELEDVGLLLFEELLQFSFLQVKDYGTEAFTVHDLLHKLAERVAGSNFFRLDDSNSGLPDDILPSVRHLCIETRNGAQIA